jgi:type IV pilus assembly protein PilY1
MTHKPESPLPARPLAPRLRSACLLLSACAAASVQALTLAESPLFLGSAVKPNVLVIYDNSFSMEALVPGNAGGSNPADPNTRGNTARRVLRQNIQDYQDAFRWGLSTFALQLPLLYPLRSVYPDSHPDPTYNYPVHYYSSGPTGVGAIVEEVKDNGSTHLNALLALLADETTNVSSGEIKNASVGTPLPGALRTARQYFSNQISGKVTPITDKTCQKNFVVLATYGDPTYKFPPTVYDTAQPYSAAEMDRGTVAAPKYSIADNDIFDQITGLRALTVSNLAAVNGSYDVRTYVIGLGDVVNNPLSVRSMNRMAELGGTGTAFLAEDENAISNAFSTIAVDIASRAAAASSVTLNTGSWNTGTRIYQARFNSGDWSGQLLAFGLAADGTVAATPSWDAAVQLNAQN